MTSTTLQALLTRLRAQGCDDDQVEVKAFVLPRGTKKNTEPKSLWESVSAFANTHGGTIILGLSEADGFTPAPGFDAQQTIDRIQQRLNPNDKSGARLDPVPDCNLHIDDVDGLRLSPFPYLHCRSTDHVTYRRGQ